MNHKLKHARGELFLAVKNKTVYIKVNPDNPEAEVIEEAGKILREGGLVAFPTETVYGLGANALNSAAVSTIFAAKGRPSDNPLIVHISDISQVHDVAEDITVPAQRVMDIFWPGPLTVVLPKKAGISNEVTAGLDTVAVRLPDHEVARAILRSAGVPIAAPSANTSGKPSPTTALHVLNDLDGKVDMIVDAGPCKVGLESTVLDLTCEPPVILRPGGVTREQLEGVIGHVEIDPALIKDDENTIPRAPGMKYTHYSPEAEVIVVTGNEEIIPFKIKELIEEYHLLGRRIGVLASQENTGLFGREEVYTLGSRSDLESIARTLFRGLRCLDEKRVEVILAEGYPRKGMGVAIMNRLAKAAGNNIILV